MRFPRDFLCLEPDELHAPGLCSFGGSSPAGNTTTTQTSEPWSGEQPFLTGENGTPGIYPTASSLYTNNVPQYYPGNTYAPLTDQQKGIMSQLIGTGTSGGTPALQSAQSGLTSTLSPDYTSGTAGAFNQGQGVLSNMLSPDYLNPWNSPSFGTVVNNTLASAIPAATSSFTNGNRSNSGLSTRAATMAATDAVGGLAQNQYAANQALQANAEGQAANNYLTQQGNQLKGMGLAPLLDQTSMTDLGTALGASGATQQDLQNQIQAAMSAYNYNQMLPWNQLGLYENAITGVGNPGGQSTTSQPYFSNTGANIMSGIGTAAGVATAAAAVATAI